MFFKFIYSVINPLPYLINIKNISTSLCNFKSLKKYIDYSKVPRLDDNDIEIQYVKGSGPGGQATNKTNNAVVIKHLPTGIVFKCHETRSQMRNEQIVKEKLIRKLDNIFNKQDSVESQEKEILRKMSYERKRRQKKRALLKEILKLQNSEEKSLKDENSIDENLNPKCLKDNSLKNENIKCESLRKENMGVD